MRTIGRMLACLLALILLAPAIARAQANTGVVQGTVTDSSGAAVPNARVELENVATGRRMTASADQNGQFRFENLAAGRYRILAGSGQVKAVPSREIEVPAGGTSTMNVTLANGTSGVNGAASAEPVAIETGTAQVDTSFNTRYIQYLPQSNFVAKNGSAQAAYNLSLLSEGVTSGGFGLAAGPSVAGQRPIGNNFRIDGIDNNNKIEPGPLAYVSNEATQTSALFQGQHTPVFGHSTGGKFDSVANTGTNEIHGAIYNYFQNRNFNAVDQSLARIGIRDNPRYDQNRLGASLGVPILPSKLFFFGNFEYIPLGFTQPFGGVSFAPTQAGFATLGQLGGVSATNLGILQSAIGQVPTAAVKTTQIGGAQIPLGIVNNATRGFQNQYIGAGSLDWNIWERDQLRLRYTHNEANANTTGVGLPAFQTDADRRGLVASIAEYHTTASGVTNELRLGYNRFELDFAPGNFTFPGLDAFPNLFIGGEANLALGPRFGLAQRSAFNTYHLADGVGLTMGRHNFRFGFDAMRYIGARSGLAGSRGNFAFSNLERFLLDLPPDVLAQQSFGGDHISDNRWLWFGYIQDSWNVAPGFQLNLGVRYQWAELPDVVRRQRFNLDASIPGVLSIREPKSDANNFAPNVGIAWSPAANRMTVFRAGFGMNYDALYSEAIYGSLLTAPVAPQFGNTVISDLRSNTPGFFAGGGLRNPLALAGGALTPEQARAATTFFIPDQKLPYSMNWNAAVQQELWRKFTIEAKYMGSRGVHLPLLARLNAVSPVTAERNLPLFFAQPSAAELNALPVTLSELRALPTNPLASAGFTSPIFTVQPDGNSIYHGLGITVKQQFAGGFQMLGNYTWSHLIDDSTGTLLDLASPVRVRDSSLLDRRHRGTLTALFDVAPLFENTFSLMRNIFANMTLSGTYTYEWPQRLPVMSTADAGLTGNAFGTGVFVNPNASGVSGSGVRPLTNALGQTVGYLANNPNARFISGAPGMFIAGGRPTIELDPINNLDLSLVKRFSYRDRIGFELRGDAYNLANHPQFTASGIRSVDFRSPQAVPVFLVPGNAEFGDFRTALASNSRVLQLALRLTF